MTLTKGQLVMTEHGLAWYNGKAYMQGNRYFVVWLDGTTDALDGTPTPATRAQVEAKVKEMGFKQTLANMWISKSNRLNVGLMDGDYCPFGTIDPDNFDTAPAQLAEAILVARMLNATKD